MSMKVTIPDFKRILVKFDNIPEKVNDNVIAALVESASDLRNEMIDSMGNSPAIGFPYKRGGKTHIASAPGYPPRKDSGDLANSFEIDINSLQGTVEIGSTIKDPDYPKFLEEGVDWWSSETTVNLLPRPYMQPALTKLTPTIENKVMNAIRKSIK